MDTNAILKALSALSTVCAIVFGYLAFARNRDSDKAEEVQAIEQQKAAAQRADATILTEIGYIKANTEEIKAEQKEQRKTNMEVMTRLASVEASAKQAHKRLDGLEHKNTV